MPGVLDSSSPPRVLFLRWLVDDHHSVGLGEGKSGSPTMEVETLVQLVNALINAARLVLEISKRRQEHRG